MKPLQSLLAATVGCGFASARRFTPACGFASARLFAATRAFAATRRSLIACSVCCGITAALVSCSDDDLQGYVPQTDTIRIVQNDLLFTAEGSSATVVVEADAAVSAQADKPWCTVAVSGTTVTVTVADNPGFDGRTALLTITAGEASRQLPVQQQGMVLDIPLPVSGYYAPTEGTTLTATIQHSLPLAVSSPDPWLHPTLDGNTLRVAVDSNQGGHIRRGTVAFDCSGLTDTLHVAQFDMTADILGSYYMMGYFGGQPSATRFDIVERDGGLFMHWPQERYASAYIPVSVDKTTCTLFIPSAFVLYTNGQTTDTGYFYDSDGRLAVADGTGAFARLTYMENTGYNSAPLTMAYWPGHTMGGFTIRSAAFVTTTLMQLANPVLIRVGPEGTTLQD